MSGGILNHAETALVPRLPPPKCFLCACTSTFEHTKGIKLYNTNTHAAKTPGTQTSIFTQQLILTEVNSDAVL